MTIKKILITLLLLMLCSSANAGPKEWLDSNSDKISHALGGGFIAGLSYKHGSDKTGIIINVLALGMVKETIDCKYSGKWDNWDIAAGIAGAVAFILF